MMLRLGVGILLGVIYVNRDEVVENVSGIISFVFLLLYVRVEIFLVKEW